MPVPGLVSQYPPFPEDVPTIEIPKVSLQKLLAEDSPTSAQLFEASKTYGFFHLDLNDSIQGNEYLEDVEDMFELDRRLHDLDVDEKMSWEYNPPKKLFG